MDLGFSERVVFVTGGTRGIGKAAAKAFAREHARVAISFHSDEARAQSVADELRVQSGVDAMIVSLDLADTATIRAAVKRVLARWGRIDALINNAVHWGSLPDDAPRFEDVDEQHWRAMLQSNLAGHYAAIQAVLPNMRERKFGRIVNVSSTIAHDGMSGSGPYATAKAGLHGLTRSLAKELGPAGILVNVVMPGLTLTETNREQIPAEVRDQIGEATPIGRLLTAEEVATPLVFLASAANTGITGEILRVSGGA